MTVSRPLNLVALTCEAVTPLSGVVGDQPSERATVLKSELHGYFRVRTGELYEALQRMRAEVEAALEDQLVDAEGLRGLGEAAHVHAEEADTLLGLLVRCRAPAHLTNSAEETFDGFRDAEEQITEALEWNKKMGRRLAKLRIDTSG